MENIRKYNNKRLTIKLLLSLVYIIIITVLFVCAYKLYEEKTSIKKWDEVESVEDYTYIKVNKMSEMFAFYEEANIGFHFVIEKEENAEKAASMSVIASPLKTAISYNSPLLIWW